MKKNFSRKLMSSVLVPVLALSLLAGCRQDPGDTHDHPTTTAPTGASHTHSYIETITAPTCTEAGYTLHTCACGDTYRDTEVVAAGHSWGEWETTLEPTAEAEGKRERKCAVCGTSEEEALPKLPEGHTHSYTETVTAPTCTEAGYTLHTCPCGDTYKDAEVAAIGHNWGEWETTLEPTTKAEGKRERKCAVCGTSEEGTLPKLPEGHTHSYTETVTAPTCTEAGYTLHTCPCGDTYKDAEVAATGHNWGEWETTLEPTTGAEGKRERKCAVCGSSEEETLPKLPEDHKHSYTVHTVDPTCTEQGYVLYTCGCGHSYKEDIRPALGHSYTETVVAPTCTEAGYTLHTCACGDCFTDQDTQPDPSKHVYTKRLINAELFDGYFDSVIGGDTTIIKENPPKDAIEYIDDRPCAHYGYYYYACDLCDHSYVGEPVPRAEHTPGGEPVEVVPPRLGRNGYTEYRCDRCRKYFQTDYTTATPEQVEAELKAIAQYTVEGINTIRELEGTRAAEVLPGLTKIAEERALQLQDAFEHDGEKIQALYDKYQYGSYNGEHYMLRALEAISRDDLGSMDAQELGYYFATTCSNSVGHWGYVGSGDYAYIGVGVSYDPANTGIGAIRISIFVAMENYG